MNIEEVKKIPLEDFLGRAGFSPVRRQGDSVSCYKLLYAL